MTLKLQHPFTHIAGWPTGCEKFTYVVKFSNNIEKLCDIGFDKIVSCQSKKNAPYNLKGISFMEDFPHFENPENKSIHIVLDNLKVSANSKKVSQMLPQGSHHRNISFTLIA
jgi:hypothetical protein